MHFVREGSSPFRGTKLFMARSKRSNTIFKGIPIIDVAPLVREEKDQILFKKTVSEMKDACRNVGFFYITNHDIPDSHIESLLSAVKATKLEYSINKGEGAFYGPKIEFVLRDAIGRDWQCGTLQVDLNLPERLGASYVDKDGSKKIPVMLHRALFGSLERFIGILIENYAGKFPFWISPLQVVVIPVSDDFDKYSKEVADKVNNSGINCQVDLKNHNLNYKIREHSLAKVPILLICGKKEVDTNSVTIRKLDSNDQENMKLDKFLEKYITLNQVASN